MRLPSDPLPSLDPIPETRQVNPTQPSPLAPRVGDEGAGQPRPELPPGRQRRTAHPGPEAQDQDAQALDIPYQGEDRRQVERRVEEKDSLIDTRGRQDRRRRNNPNRVDFKA